MNGALKFIKYAYPPNELRYCGPSNHRAVFDYFQQKKLDEGLIELLSKFNGAYPNLCYIAASNRIKDPFDAKVVEAYWVGNNLLNQASIADYYQYLKDQHKGQWDNHALDLVFGASKPYGAKPHHSFHVLSLFAKKRRTRAVLKHIGNCLILPGLVKKISLDSILVRYRPIIVEGNGLVFGSITSQKLKCFDERKINEGDQISFHWNWICDKLTDKQINNLNFWNRFHVELINKIM